MTSLTPPEKQTRRPHDQPPPICDYEGSDYRTRFWENAGRAYEDRVERIALRRLLPSAGKRMLEVGAGFGRVTNEYEGYQQTILLDYSFSQLAYARERLGGTSRHAFVAADAYRMPFKVGVFDGVSMIRVLHHMADVPAVLSQIRRVLAPRGTFILEYANKRHLKSVLRYALRRQSWSPYDESPVEFVELNFDFHPAYVRRELQKAGFVLERQLPVSYFRIEPIKRIVPVNILAGLDSALQLSGLLYSPSVFSRSKAIGSTSDNLNIPLGEDGDILPLLACPNCGGDLAREGDTVVCQRDHMRYAVRDGIYDFKATVE